MYILLNLDASKLNMCLLNSDKKFLFNKDIALCDTTINNSDNLLNFLLFNIDELLVCNNLKHCDIEGIGVIINGLVNNGVIISHESLPFKNLDLKSILISKFNLTNIYVVNNVECALLCEYESLKLDMLTKDIAYFDWGSSINMKLLLNGEIIKGSGSGSAGLIGSKRTNLTNINSLYGETKFKERLLIYDLSDNIKSLIINDGVSSLINNIEYCYVNLSLKHEIDIICNFFVNTIESLILIADIEKIVLGGSMFFKCPNFVDTIKTKLDSKFENNIYFDTDNLIKLSENQNNSLFGCYSLLIKS